MYTQQEIDKTLRLYEQTHSIRKVVKRLGYPSKTPGTLVERKAFNRANNA